MLSPMPQGHPLLHLEKPDHTQINMVGFIAYQLLYGYLMPK